MSSSSSSAKAAQEQAEWEQIRREVGSELAALEREIQSSGVSKPAVTPSYSAAADIGKTAASNFTAWRSNTAEPVAAAPAPKKKICCACPETRSLPSLRTIGLSQRAALPHKLRLPCPACTFQTCTSLRAIQLSVLRKPRDECVMMKGEENCAEFIEAHKKCLRAEGFNV